MPNSSIEYQYGARKDIKHAIDENFYVHIVRAENTEGFVFLNIPHRFFIIVLIHSDLLCCPHVCHRVFSHRHLGDRLLSFISFTRIPTLMINALTKRIRKLHRTPKSFTPW